MHERTAFVIAVEQTQPHLTHATNAYHKVVLAEESTRMMISVVEPKKCLWWAWWEHRLIS